MSRRRASSKMVRAVLIALRDGRHVRFARASTMFDLQRRGLVEHLSLGEWRLTMDGLMCVDGLS